MPSLLSRQFRSRLPIVAALLIAFAGGGCSVRKMAMSTVADALSGATSSTFATDDDPELVRESLPFALKLMETILADLPDHRALLTATSSGFVQYSYAFVQQDADLVELEDVERAKELRKRARKLNLRARDYGLRGLETVHPDFEERFRADAKTVARELRSEDLPLIYWTAAAWGSAVSVSKDDPEVIAEVAYVEVLIDRALELDESYGDGAIHSFLIAYESLRPGGEGTVPERQKKHFERAVALSSGQMAGPYVSYAEAVMIPNQDSKGFRELLEKAIAIDVDKRKDWRLANLIAQKRAKWLLGRTEDLILDLEPLPEDDEALETAAAESGTEPPGLTIGGIAP